MSPYKVRNRFCWAVQEHPSVYIIPFAIEHPTGAAQPSRGDTPAGAAQAAWRGFIRVPASNCPVAQGRYVGLRGTRAGVPEHLGVYKVDKEGEHRHAAGLSLGFRSRPDFVRLSDERDVLALRQFSHATTPT
jgi:hypothetical protein